MSDQTPVIPLIPEEQVTPIVRVLLEILQRQEMQITYLKEENQKLKDEIALLKKGNPKPKIQPSSLEKLPKPQAGREKRPGSAKRSKTRDLKIHNIKRIKPKNIPEGAIFKDLHSFVVQDIRIENHNTLYQLERWRGLDGSYHIGKLPENISGHYGPALTSYILYQYYGMLVTRPALLKQLHEFDIDISRGQLNAMLIDKKESFHQEKSDVLSMGVQVSSYIQTDDTKARHAGKNGFCTVISSDFFTWFSSTDSKSRINFLELLHGPHIKYVINEDALAYVNGYKGMEGVFKRLEENPVKAFDNGLTWLEHLKILGITKALEIRIATEGVLLGALIAHGIPKNLAILSDDAGQFNVFDHFLCWIHEERHLKEIVPYNEQNRLEIENILDRFWRLYQGLKSYQKTPSIGEGSVLEQEFDDLFKTETSSNIFNLALRNIYNKKDELLKVLKRPEVPLHNNGSEREIREYVKRRKISGGTRSNTGKACRDTFTSLKKTCYKLGITFWQFLTDRINGTKMIEYLPIIIKNHSLRISASNTS